LRADSGSNNGDGVQGVSRGSSNQSQSDGSGAASWSPHNGKSLSNIISLLFLRAGHGIESEGLREGAGEEREGRNGEE
jgi:hypothetical protein